MPKREKLPKIHLDEEMQKLLASLSDEQKQAFAGINHVAEALSTTNDKGAYWMYKNLMFAISMNANPSVPFSSRVEGNALAALCFRNGPLEDAHAGVFPLAVVPVRL